MVNNVGIVQVQFIVQIIDVEMDWVFVVNVKGVLWGIQVVVVCFKKDGIRGKIIFVVLIVVYEGFLMLGVYCLMKFVVCVLIQVVVKEFVGDGIMVNVYCFGVVGIDMWIEIDVCFVKFIGVEIGVIFDKFVGFIVFGWVQILQDVVSFVFYFVGFDSDYMIGQLILIDGGMVYY